MYNVFKKRKEFSFYCFLETENYFRMFLLVTNFVYKNKPSDNLRLRIIIINNFKTFSLSSITSFQNYALFSFGDRIKDTFFCVADLYYVQLF